MIVCELGSGASVGRTLKTDLITASMSSSFVNSNCVRVGTITPLPLGSSLKINDGSWTSRDKDTIIHIYLEIYINLHLPGCTTVGHEANFRTSITVSPV